jgi:hypothetical protein
LLNEKAKGGLKTEGLTDEALLDEKAKGGLQTEGLRKDIFKGE